VVTTASSITPRKSPNAPHLTIDAVMAAALDVRRTEHDRLARARHDVGMPAAQGIPGVPAPTSIQASTPYADALLAYAEAGWLRLGVPGHRGKPIGAPGIAAAFGEVTVDLDISPMIEGIDKGPRPTPLEQSLALAAEAWGAARTWFLTNGASQGNLVAAVALRQLGRQLVVQRSVHSSVIDGLALSGMGATFVQPEVDRELGVAHGVTAANLAEALRLTPDAVAAIVASPNYFGAVSDVRALADTAHGFGVPLVVDEAWGPHLGFHPDLPQRALSLGADLVVSSTHKLGGSLTQSAMLHLGRGPYAELLEPAIDRAFRSLQSTSESAVLLLSLDVARRRLAVDGEEVIGATIEATERVRDAIRAEGRFALADDRFLRSRDVVAIDPLRVVIDTRAGGISGHRARHVLAERERIHVELATDAVIVAIIGPGEVDDLDRFLPAVHRLPRLADQANLAAPEHPSPGPTAMSVRDAYFARNEFVARDLAIGRIAADSMAAYPPGIPNVLPGEVLTAEIVDFLTRTAASPTGLVRGSLDPDMSAIRVVARD
jgi:arginine/lysine/ornithine decarboxylase